jgi:hypothetical protein
MRKNGPRIILFILGGITSSEIRTCYDIMKSSQRDIVIGIYYNYHAFTFVIYFLNYISAGSTHTITPHTFLDSLKTLHRVGESPKAEFPYSLAPSRSSSSAGALNNRSAHTSQQRIDREPAPRGAGGSQDRLQQQPSNGNYPERGVSRYNTTGSNHGSSQDVNAASGRSPFPTRGVSNPMRSQNGDGRGSSSQGGSAASLDPSKIKMDKLSVSDQSLSSETGEKKKKWFNFSKK